jgi:CheY-like chemotaxis protein
MHTVNNPKIILIEDDVFLRDLYKEILQDAGYTILVAGDGEEGVRLSKSNPDAKLILLDILLPKLHGIDVLKQLKSDMVTKHLPVVVFTNLTQDAITKEALRLGAFAYLVKVRYTPQQVVEKINELIQFHEKQDKQ